MAIIEITPEAWDVIQEKLETSNAKTLVLGVSNTGCNGHSYTFGTSLYVPATGEDCLQKDGYYVSIAIGTESYFQGSTLDWAGDDIFSKHFVFTNPNSSSECGCGESFSV